MAGGLKKQVEEEVVATPSTKEETIVPAVDAVEETAPLTGHPSRDFTSK